MTSNEVSQTNGWDRYSVLSDTSTFRTQNGLSTASVHSSQRPEETQRERSSSVVHGDTETGRGNGTVTERTGATRGRGSLSAPEIKDLTQTLPAVFHFSPQTLATSS